MGVDPYGDPASGQGLGPAPEQRWCAVHDLAAGPDGRCMVCRREETAERSEARLVWIVMTVVLLLGVGPAAFYFFYWRHQEKPPTRQSSARPAQADMGRRSADPEGDELDALERAARNADARRRAREDLGSATGGSGGGGGAEASPKGSSAKSERSRALERAKAAATARRKAAEERRAEAMRKWEEYSQGQAKLTAAIKQVSITAYMADW